jgi:hypothetical protein
MKNVPPGNALVSIRKEFKLLSLLIGEKVLCFKSQIGFSIYSSTESPQRALDLQRAVQRQAAML